MEKSHESRYQRVRPQEGLRGRSDVLEKERFGWLEPAIPGGEVATVTTEPAVPGGMVATVTTLPAVVCGTALSMSSIDLAGRLRVSKVDIAECDYPLVARKYM